MKARVDGTGVWVGPRGIGGSGLSTNGLGFRTLLVYPLHLDYYFIYLFILFGADYGI